MSRIIYIRNLIRPDAYIHTNFKLYRNKLNHLLKISKKEYYNSYFFDNIYDSKKIWKRVNFKPPTSVKHIELRVNDREIASPIEVANALNTYFSSIGNDLTKSIPIVEKSPMELQALSAYQLTSLNY